MILKSDTQKIILHQNVHQFIDQYSFLHPQLQEEIFINFEAEEDVQLGKEIFDLIIETFNTSYFDDLEKSIEDRFEECLKEVNIKINELYKETQKDRIKINAIISVMSAELLFLTQSGNAEAYLIRNNKLNIISDSLSPISETETFLSVATGEIMPDDVLILTTSRLLRFLSNSQLISIYKSAHDEAIATIEDFAKANECHTLGLISIMLKKAQSIKDITPGASSRIPGTLPQKWSLLSQKINSLWSLHKDKVSHKGLLIGIFLVVVILVLSISFLSSQVSEERDLETYRTVLKEIDQEIQKAQTFQMQGDNQLANGIIDNAEKKLTTILNANVFRSEAVIKSDLIKQTKEEINNIERISAPKVLADLSEKRSGVESLGLIYFKNNLYAYDYNALYKTILSLVETPLTIHDTEITTTATAMEDRALIVFYTQNGQVIEFKNDNFVFADTQDETWKKAVDLGVFKKNLYLLDPASNQIWKYVRNNSEYSNSTEYIKDNNIDISNANSLAIDGSVYVLKNNGEIIEFYAGQKTDFVVKDLPEGIMANASKIFTDIDQRNLYVLDSNNNRIIVIEKASADTPARYKKQYILENINPIQDIYVEQTEQKMFLLDKQKIYEVPLT
jgi:hypothetical protein